MSNIFKKLKNWTFDGFVACKPGILMPGLHAMRVFFVDYSRYMVSYWYEPKSTNPESPACGVQCVPRLGLLRESYVDS